MPTPILNVRSISASSKSPSERKARKTGGICRAAKSSLSVEAQRQDAAEVVAEAAAGDVGHAVEDGVGEKAAHGLQVASMGLEHRIKERFASHIGSEQIGLPV